MKNILLGGSFAASLLLSLNVNATALSEYSLIVEKNYEHSSAVWGRTFIGGNMVSNGGEFGTRLSNDDTLPTLTVAGSIRGSTFNIMAGDIEYGGKLRANVSFNGGGTATDVGRKPLREKRDSLVSELKQTSADYAQTDSNGKVKIKGNNTTFKYTGNDKTAVFDINASDVFFQNSLLQLDKGNAETVVFNISTQSRNLGFDFLAPGGINFGNGFNSQSASNILWNFYDAKNLDLQDLKMRGSVLAIGANLISIGTIDGSIAAKSFIQDSQIHNYTFTPPSEVPLPASIQFMLMGLAGIVLARRLRKKKLQA